MHDHTVHSLVLYISLLVMSMCVVIAVTVPPVEREWKTGEIAKVGELLLDITVQITKA